MPSSRNSKRSPGPGAAVGIVVLGAIALAAVVLLASGLLESDDVGTSAANASVRKALAEPDGAPRRNAPPNPIAVVVRPTALRAAPGGRRIARVRTKTEFGSARVLPVVARRGGWLRVIASELANGKRGWIDARATEPGAVDFRIRADLSARRIEIRRNGRLVRRIRTAVGEQGTPTPTGTFGVTDKVPFTDRGSPYGCCAVALSAHQPDTPSEWSGGDRIAIHATPVSSSIGRSVTLGCMRVPVADARWMMKNLPLGTLVSIRA